MSAREFDIVVYGASGYTGRLVAEYLARRTVGESSLKWAMAGRSMEKLAAVSDEIGVAPARPLVFADASDSRSLGEMAARSKVVLSTVGPYQLYGSDLVAACVEHGTDYVDLCGEPIWMRRMIEAHEKTAKVTGARIVFSCGFGSVPFDLGVRFLQGEANARFGTPCAEIKARVRRSRRGGEYSSVVAAVRKPNRKDQCVAKAPQHAPVLCLNGAFAKNQGFLAALQEFADTDSRLNIRLLAHQQSILAGALGASLWGAFRHVRLREAA